jgi:hypothetical protein
LAFFRHLKRVQTAKEYPRRRQHTAGYGLISQVVAGLFGILRLSVLSATFKKDLRNAGHRKQRRCVVVWIFDSDTFERKDSCCI